MPIEKDAEAYGRALLKSELSKETHDYLSRGRLFANTPDEHLRSDWVVAVRRWIASRHPSHAREVDDLAAEMRLRSLEAPYDELGPELKAEMTGRNSPESNG
jgi:hypothetical protein